MKIGVYNRYWTTCGGGENYTGSIAEALSHDHEVELISVESVDWGKIQSRLRLDLSRCSMQQWPNEPCAVLSPLSAQYDLFINSTYCSSMVPRSKHSALICYFPHNVGFFPSVKSFIKQKLRNPSIGIRTKAFTGFPIKKSIFVISGVHPKEKDGRAWGKREVVLAISSPSEEWVHIPLWPNSYIGIQSIHSDGTLVSWKIKDDELLVMLPATGQEFHIITIMCEPMTEPLKPCPDPRELGLCFDLRKESWRGNPTQLIQRLAPTSPKKALASYNRIISISNFTSEWIGRRWHLPSFELPPPVDTDTFRNTDGHSREKIILSVGRFFAGGHNKKHHEMAKAFIRLRKSGRIPEDWRLVFIGARHREHQIHLDYFNSLVALCAGHPIDIFVDLPFEMLLEYYRKAPIYWHAAGWGERISKYPERFEHFGMTTCEAMASGCVPVVFDAAGQQEIVDSTEVGFRFSNYEALAQQMERLTKADSMTLNIIGLRAQASISRYARSSFKEKVRNAFTGLAY